MSKLLTDSTTETMLGPQVLAELRATLQPVDCQTCGRPFGRREKPALVVQAVGDFADASLHHRHCRPPRWRDHPPTDAPEIRGFPHVTWRATLAMLSGGVLAFLVNPSYEYATLRRDGGRWRLATLDPFAAVGMGTNLLDAVISVPSLSFVVDESRVSAYVSGDVAGLGKGWHVSPLSQNARDLLDMKEWITIGVTTALDLRKPLHGNPLPALMAAGQVRLGAARRTYTEQAQRLGPSDVGKEVQVETHALSCALIKHELGIEVSDDLLVAAFACSDGHSELIERLHGRDKLVSVVLVAQLYAIKARPASGQPAHGGGVHVMASDAAGVAECFEMFAILTADIDETVVRLADQPTADQRQTEYLADVVIGTPEQFHAAYAFYRDDADDWGLHETRGWLAICIGRDVWRRAGEVIRRYPKVAVV